MNIQWYPGHMHKAAKEVKQILPQVDIFIEILDARIPFSSENPMLADLRAGKPCIKVLNKYDLADPEMTQQWQNYMEQEQGVKTLATTVEQPEKIRTLADLCLKILAVPDSNTRLIRAMIMGIPNVGKSTLINLLAGKVVAKTGNEPAVTKAQQKINIGKNIVLLDTPGMLWPNVENRNSGYRLAATGAIKDTAISHDDIAYFVADYLLKNYPHLLSSRYQLHNRPKTELELLEIIGRNRGCLRSGGLVDYDKTAKLLLADFRSGKIGRITLETPEMMQQELIELERIRAEKAQKKLARKLKRKQASI